MRFIFELFYLVFSEIGMLRKKFMSISSYIGSSYVLGRNDLDSVSAVANSLPGQYSTVMEYFCIAMIIRWSLVGAWYNGFFNMASRGL